MPDTDRADEPKRTHSKSAQKEKNELASIPQGELSTVMYSPLGLSFEKAFDRQIFLDEVHVAGVTHIKNIKTYVKKLKVGDRLTLLREPKNEYDELAVLVKDEKGHKLGYVPKRCNSVIARLLDAGKRLYAVIDDIDLDEDVNVDQLSGIPWNLLLIAIYMDD